MDTEQCVRVFNTVFDPAQRSSKMFLFKHGTIVELADVPEADDAYAIRVMQKLAEKLGPYEGEGSELGDFDTQRLRNFNGYMVWFAWPIVTYVGDDEVGARPPDDSPQMLAYEARIGLVGRHKRNLDARRPEIIARKQRPAA